MATTNYTKQICIFSGSFNPIHIGHVAIASYIKEFYDMDEVWLVVTPHNPLKKADELLDNNTRFDMVKLATENIEGLIASDIEFSLPTPTYTVETLRELTHRHPTYQFTLAIGSDNWNSFEQWKDYRTILDSYPVMVYPRLGYPVSKEIIPNNVKLIDAPIMEISSTFIRQSIKDNKNMRAFLPLDVYDYIREHNVYEQKL